MAVGSNLSILQKSLMVKVYWNCSWNVAPRWFFKSSITIKGLLCLPFCQVTWRCNEDRGIFDGGLPPRVTPILHWQYVVLIDSGSEKSCFHSDLLCFDAFLLIFHCDRGSMCNQARSDPSPEIWAVAANNGCRHTGSTFQMLKVQVRIWVSFWYLACWFYYISATAKPSLIGISFKQTTQLNFNFLKLVSGRGQGNYGDENFSWP